MLDRQDGSFVHVMLTLSFGTSEIVVTDFVTVHIFLSKMSLVQNADIIERAPLDPGRPRFLHRFCATGRMELDSNSYRWLKNALYTYLPCGFCLPSTELASAGFIWLSLNLQELMAVEMDNILWLPVLGTWRMMTNARVNCLAEDDSPQCFCLTSD